MAQLTHMLQLLCRHYKVYFPVRQHLVQHMISSIQRLGLTANVSTRIYTLLLYIVQDGEKLCVSPKNVQPFCFHPYFFQSAPVKKLSPIQKKGV